MKLAVLIKVMMHGSCLAQHQCLHVLLLFSCRALEDHEWQLTERQLRYGTNDMAIPVQGILALVADEMWHPFYVFQYFSVVIWMAGDAYYTYAVCIFLITWFSIITSAIETHRNMKRLAELAHYTCTVSMLGRPTAQGVAGGDLFAQSTEAIWAEGMSECGSSNTTAMPA